jgi:hypothetical protein
MAGLLRLETPKVMNAEDLTCSEIRYNTRCLGNIVVMDERTTSRKLYGFTKCLGFEHGSCRTSLCWRVFLVVIMVFM